MKSENKKIVSYLILAAVLSLMVLNFEKVVQAIFAFFDIIFPLLLGIIIAYIINILLRKLEKNYFPNSKKSYIVKSRRPICVLLSLLCIIGAIILVIRIILPALVEAITIMSSSIPIIFEEFRQWLMQYSDQFPVIEESFTNLDIDWKQLSENVLGYATSGVTGILNSTISIIGTFASGLMTLIVALIFSIYFLLGKGTLQRQMKNLLKAYLKEEKTSKILDVLRIADQSFSNFIIGQCTEAVILGALCTMGMLLFRFPYAPMIGVVVGVTALIPIVGAYIGATLGAFMILTIDPVQAALFVLFIVILQQFEGNLIYPKVVGGSIGLPGLWVLAAVTIGGGLFGIPGMLIGVPTVATVYKLLAYDVHKKLTAQEEMERVKEI